MVCSYDRTARLPTDESKQFQRDEANRLKHIKGARSAFSALLKELQPLEVFLRAATVPKTAGTAPRALGVLLEALKDELEEAGVYQI